MNSGMRRHTLLRIYLNETRKSLTPIKLTEHIYTTNFRSLSLQEYAYARSLFCKSKHSNKPICTECPAIISIAN